MLLDVLVVQYWHGLWKNYGWGWLTWNEDKEIGDLGTEKATHMDIEATNTGAMRQRRSEILKTSLHVVE